MHSFSVLRDKFAILAYLVCPGSALPANRIPSLPLRAGLALGALVSSSSCLPSPLMGWGLLCANPDHMSSAGRILQKGHKVEQPRKKGKPPPDADIVAVVQRISHRVIRTLHQLGYLKAGIDAPVAGEYDPLGEHTPALALILVASVQQRIAFEERPNLVRPPARGRQGSTRVCTLPVEKAV